MSWYHTTDLMVCFPAVAITAPSSIQYASESQFSLTQWMSAGPLFTEGDIYDSRKYPIACFLLSCVLTRLLQHRAHQVLWRTHMAKTITSHMVNQTLLLVLAVAYHWLDEVFDGNAYTWSYDNHTGYDAGFSSLPEPAGYSNTFSPTISVVSCSPRSEHSGMSEVDS